mmetsp:Transcript_26013/g.56406  ORF Transcript_26013/g.56406 Transcript_26013/m.56406 type:complete len:273 (+) Transcript_26013:1984-2802(+)
MRATGVHAARRIPCTGVLDRGAGARPACVRHNSGCSGSEAHRRIRGDLPALQHRVGALLRPSGLHGQVCILFGHAADDSHHGSDNMCCHCMWHACQCRHCARGGSLVLLHCCRHAGASGQKRDGVALRPCHVLGAAAARSCSSARVHAGPITGTHARWCHPHWSHHDRSRAGYWQNGCCHHGDYCNGTHAAAAVLPCHCPHRQRRDFQRYHSSGGAGHFIAHREPGALLCAGRFPRWAAIGRDGVPPAGGVGHRPLPWAAAGAILHDGGHEH